MSNKEIRLYFSTEKRGGGGFVPVVVVVVIGTYKPYTLKSKAQNSILDLYVDVSFLSLAF